MPHITELVAGLRDQGFSQAALDRMAAELRGGIRDTRTVLIEFGVPTEQVAALIEQLAEPVVIDRTVAESPYDASDSDISHDLAAAANEPSVEDLIERLLDIGDRFELQGEIARGAMGRILAGWDQHLGRAVAIKVLRKSAARDLDRIRFIEEAQVTGQLQHPSIMPVYELGRLRGQAAFVMRRVEGRSLKQIIAQLRTGDLEARQQFGRIRLLGLFQQLCLAVGFAHAKGVVHRDLKPSNVMIGDYGEVVLLDWGLCKIVGQDTRSSRSISERWRTMHGQIIGTPAYMAPEQAMGLVDQISESTDVYGLGAILYHLLSLRPPFSGKSNREIVQRVLRESVMPIRQRAPEQNIPADLETICMRCLARDPEDRYPNARSLADAITGWLERPSQRSQQADSQPLVREAMSAIVRHQSLQEDLAIERFSLVAGRERAALGHGDPDWAAEQRLDVIRTELASTFATAVHALTQAVALSPDDQDAQQLLTDLYQGRYELALSRQDQPQAEYYRHLLSQVAPPKHAAATHAALVAGEGGLHVIVEPEGVAVQLTPLEERNGRRVPGTTRDAGRAPVHVDRLPTGSYLLTAEVPGFDPLRAAVTIQAGHTARLRLRMLAVGVRPEGFVHIPSGTFSVGDPNDRSRPAGEQALTDYLIGRVPVSNRAYLVFLQALAVHAPNEAPYRVPRLDAFGALWPRQADGTYRLPNGTDPGGAWAPDAPVVCISPADAAAYCAWYASQTGQTVRLASSAEWEKAARGTDGRTYPWGNRWHPGFAVTASTWRAPWPPPAGQTPTDISPYGVLDLAGGVREWTIHRVPGEPERTIVRGGSFLCGAEPGHPLWHHAIYGPEHCARDIGFRLVQETPRIG
jgi:serine/threonine-protein kinase